MYIYVQILKTTIRSNAHDVWVLKKTYNHVYYLKGRYSIYISGGFILFQQEGESIKNTNW